MNSNNSFKIVTYKLFTYKLYIHTYIYIYIYIYIYTYIYICVCVSVCLSVHVCVCEQDLAINNAQGLICHQRPTNQTKSDNTKNVNKEYDFQTSRYKTQDNVKRR